MALFVAGISHADGPVVAWGSNGSLWPPASVDGTAIAIAAGYEHTLAIQVPEPTIALLCTFALLMLALLRRRVA